MEFLAADGLTDEQSKISDDETNHGFKYKDSLKILKPFRFTK